ncbi:MAG: tetratricopeptide repeat protein [Candidatus Hermodarchaeota archaeon]
MSGTHEINYPSEEIQTQLLGEKQNTEHLILWMLKNNEAVGWSNFMEEPIGIPQSTLSNYMATLITNGFVKKPKRGIYEITVEGEKRFNELSRSQETKRKLSYPPDTIIGGRNYDDIILWMAYNNNYLKWADFIDSDSPVFINQSSLSKNIKLLVSKGSIKKDDQTKEYQITQKGKTEYSKMLKQYNLDRQSILDEEAKRIEEITKKTIAFFEKYKIKDGDVKFRFLNNILKLPFANLKGSLDSEEEFNKILLFLSMNHPNQFPDYIPPEQFSKKYFINLLDLKFNIRQIIEKEAYTTKFFRLKAGENIVYYFQANEKIEKVLSAITEDHITKFTYLNKLYVNTPKGAPKLSLNSTVNAILEEICDNLFHEGLKEPLREFLPEYIKNLAYKIESERKLLDTLDKLEGVAWRDIPEVFQSYSTQQDLIEQAQFKYYIDYSILKVLSLFSSPKIEKKFEEAKYLMKHKDFDNVLEKLNSDIESEPNNLNLLFLKVIFLILSNRHQEAIRFLKEELKSYSNKNDEKFVIPYNFILLYINLVLAEFNKALKISKKLSDEYPDHPLSYISKALIFGYKIIYQLDLGNIRIDQVLVDIDQAISLDSNKGNKAKYYHFKSFVLHQIKKYDEALEAIETAIELDPKDLHLHFMKYNILYDYEKIDKALELVDQAIKEFPKYEIKLSIHKAFLYKKNNNFKEGLKIINDLLEKYPHEVDLLNNKLYWHLYLQEKNEAIETGKLLTTLEPDDGNFHDSYAEALMEFGEYDEAIKEIQKALELEPYGWFTYNSYLTVAKCYKEIGEYNFVREALDKGEGAINTCFCGIEKRREWKDKKLKLLNELENLERTI